MKDKASNKGAKRYGWNGMMSSDGRLHLDLYFENAENISADDLVRAAADSLSSGVGAMEQKGYIPPNARLMSSREVADEFGFTRQYWEKLLREGKLPYYQTAAGRITIDLWVKGYLQNREKVDAYVGFQNEALKNIKALGQTTHSPIRCPQCGNETLRFAKNGAEANGVCDSGCGFQFTAAI